MAAFPSIDVKQVRRRMKMTQEDFAWTYGIPLSALRNWEQRRRNPDTMALAYLNIINMEPELTAKFIAHKREQNRARIAAS